MAHSKRYQSVARGRDVKMKYSVADAVANVKRTATVKFDSSIEMNINLGIDTKKPEQQIRGSFVLPHGSGKKIRIAAFVPADRVKEAEKAGAELVGSEELIESIQQNAKIEFDVAVATPDMMPKMAKIAKILGPRGLMPSPKSETVTQNVAKTIEDLKKGKVAFKNDDTGNVHIMVGKASWDAQKLNENIDTALETIKKAKPSSMKGVYLKSVTLSSTMGPGFRIEA